MPTTMTPNTQGTLSSATSRARIAGAAAAAVALGTGELVSSFNGRGQSLIGGVGNEVVDRTAGDIVRGAISVFGTHDKTALVIGIVVVSLLLGAWLGRLSLRRRWAGPVGFAVFGVLGAIAGIRDPLTAGGLAVTAGIAATVTGSITLLLLLHLIDTRLIETPTDLPVTTATRASRRTIERPEGGRGPRRAFFAWAGAAGAFAVVASVAASSLKNSSRAEASRATVRLPSVGSGGGSSAGPTATVAGSPAGFDIDGLTPYLVPNESFYRIDTALVVPQVPAEGWSMQVTGMVDRPFELSFDELLAEPMVEEIVTLSCVSNEVGGSLVGNARWQGVPLRALLDRAGVQPGATQIVGKSVDGFTVGFPTEAVYDGRVALVAVGMNGEPLPVTHGFPARLVVAGLYGYVSATKWLKEIRLTRLEDFDAYWIPRGWSKEAPVKTESRIDVPRSGAQVSAGTTAVAGVAWAPSRGIDKVEVQVDDGPWTETELGPSLSNNAWRQWHYAWDAPEGDHVLRVRATDGTGETQTATINQPNPDGASGYHGRRVRVSDA